MVANQYFADRMERRSTNGVVSAYKSQKLAVVDRDTLLSSKQAMEPTEISLCLPVGLTLARQPYTRSESETKTFLL